MLAILKSFGLNGIKGYVVQVEVDINKGLPGIDMVGLPDASIKESKERVKSAIKNSGLYFTPLRVTVNLAPADTKKEGSIYDLSIAMGILGATGQVSMTEFDKIVFIGELSLDGKLKRINGLLPMLISAKEKGFTKFIVPSENSGEASYIDGLDVYAFRSLSEVMDFLNKKINFEPVSIKSLTVDHSFCSPSQDFKYIKGQAFARRAMEIAVAGGHNVLLIGPPGGGKTMLAKCLPSIMPDMTLDEALETTKIHSVAGTLDPEAGIILNRPFRTPHHTSSRVALTGGGPSAKPGEISLAHNGVLFLDELLEYPRNTLEILRQPLEDNVITISRSMRTVSYPADFMLVASMNPCPCGNFGSKIKECTCSPVQVAKYLSRLSGPLLDRIDLHVEVDNVTYSDISEKGESEESFSIKRRVDEARKIQYKRFQECGITHNSRMQQHHMKEFCVLDDKSELLIKKAFEKLGLSVRAYTRIIKVARTIADLAGVKDISFEHVTEAIAYRSLDRSYWT